MMKNRIKKWLGITKLEKENVQLRKRLELQRTHIARMTSKITAAEERVVLAEERGDQLADIFAVGMDWSPSGYDRSWIVVCIKGKMERVQFLDVSNKDAKEISRYLSVFNKENVTIDAGPGNNLFQN